MVSLIYAAWATRGRGGSAAIYERGVSAALRGSGKAKGMRKAPGAALERRHAVKSFRRDGGRVARGESDPGLNLAGRSCLNFGRDGPTEGRSKYLAGISLG